MKYDHVAEAVFLDRPNRFIARVMMNGRTETVHVKNTGRCRELLIPGAQVYLTAPGTQGRKTVYDLIAVRKSTGVLFNIDSQAPNAVVREWLEDRDYDRIIPEYRFGESRIDFCMEKNGVRYLVEVKGCTLEINGTGYFPDAPTERGTKHLRELIKAAADGYQAMICFVIQMDGVKEVRANGRTDPAFEKALNEAAGAGVGIMYLPCHVEPDGIWYAC